MACEDESHEVFKFEDKVKHGGVKNGSRDEFWQISAGTEVD